MGWEDAHLHQFIVNGDCYGVYDPQFPNDMQNESSYLLCDLVGEDEQLTYGYDFGDDWVHEIKIERVLTADPGKHYPCALAASAPARPKTAPARPATNIFWKSCVTRSTRNTTNFSNGPVKTSPRSLQPRNRQHFL